jgi:hypothetical protein
MSKNKNVVFTYSDDVDDDVSDGDVTPTNKVDGKGRMSIFDVVCKDRELTDMSTSTTMTTLEVPPMMSPSKERREENVENVANGRQNDKNVDLINSISYLSEQLRHYGADFVDIRSRMSTIETTLQPTLENDASSKRRSENGVILKVTDLPDSKNSNFGQKDLKGPSRFVSFDLDEGPIRTNSAKLRYIHYRLRKSLY